MGSSRELGHLTGLKRLSQQQVHIIRCVAPKRLLLTTNAHPSIPIEDRQPYARWRCLSTKRDRQDAAIVHVHQSILLDYGCSSRYMSDETTVESSFATELIEGLLESDYLLHATSETVTYAAQMLLAQLLQSRSAMQRADLTFEEWQVEEVVRFLREANTRDASIKEIADHCGLSVCHFSRVFKAQYGMPVYQFILQERIKQAQTRLLFTADPIADIALECGFSDQSSFTRRFTSVIGIPPAAWRKMSGSAQEMSFNSAV